MKYYITSFDKKSRTQITVLSGNIEQTKVKIWLHRSQKWWRKWRYTHEWKPNFMSIIESRVSEDGTRQQKLLWKMRWHKQDGTRRRKDEKMDEESEKDDKQIFWSSALPTAPLQLKKIIMDLILTRWLKCLLAKNYHDDDDDNNSSNNSNNYNYYHRHQSHRWGKYNRYSDTIRAERFVLRIAARETSPFQKHPVLYSKDAWVLSQRQSARVLLLTTHLHFIPGWRSGAMPLFPLCAFTRCTGDNFSFFAHGWDYNFHLHFWLWVAWFQPQLVSISCLVT